MASSGMGAFGSALVGVASLLFLGSGCQTEAFCFVCEDGQGLSDGDASDGGATGGNGGNISLNDGGPDADDGGGTGGTTGTGGADAGCEDTQNDVFNCGFCGNACQLNGAFPVCVQGECRIDECFPGRQNVNGLHEDGCEGACVETNNGVEICDNLDNDCDGSIDEDFDLESPERCGSCNATCNLPNATAACVDVGDEEFQCEVDVCFENVSSGFRNNDGIHSNGCEEQCEVWPATAEVCNGLDDNCDGTADEGAPGAGEMCQEVCPNGLCRGQCTPGETVCVGTGLTCVRTVNTIGPSIEVCDPPDAISGLSVDEDCDGDTNEGFNLDTDINNCGECGIVCNQLPNAAVEQCSLGTCDVLVCEDGFGDLTEGTVMGDEGCEYPCPVWPPVAETCDGVDNDCDGLVDGDDPSLVLATFCLQTGPCFGSTATCEMGQWECNYQELDSRIEVEPTEGFSAPEQGCDGFDNNCDGAIDEGLTVYETCLDSGDCGSGTCDVGRCTCDTDDDCSEGHICADDDFCRPECFDGTGACQAVGSFACDPGDPAAIVCDAEEQPTAATDELCNNLDDNCDGQIDERVPLAGTQCYNGGQHDCVELVDDMVLIDSAVDFWIYRFEASRPDATDASAGLQDERRACSEGNRLPWTSVNRQQAADACAAIEDGVGSPMRLCTQAEWEEACLAGNPGPAWSFEVNATTYSTDICNDRQHSTQNQTVWPGGTGAACYADSTNGAIYDLSGNVAEWTSSTTTVNMTEYYRVRGGSATSFGVATACNNSFVLHKPEFANFDLGFRCCSDNAP